MAEQLPVDKGDKDDKGRLGGFGKGLRAAVRDFTHRTTAALQSYFQGSSSLGHVHERKSETLESLECFAESQQQQGGLAGTGKSKDKDKDQASVCVDEERDVGVSFAASLSFLRCMGEKKSLFY